MSTERRHLVEELFEQALEIPPDDRASWLEDRCRGDGSLRAEVEALVAAHERADGVLERPPPDAGLSVPSAGSVGQRREIGAYRVLREIGRGGMGVVYLAERDDGQFRRRVAIKLLRPPYGEEVHQRFLTERQILASLGHPNIAQLLDGGVTAGQIPYLVMEYVDGEPITDYCDHRRLGVPERLALFREVCAAVHHAHQNLVIHRDIKPGNILVTRSGNVKLLDFGIAKLLNPALGGMEQPVTRKELRLMTPEYASPEQVRGEPLTTASDVYSLGVVLYELLAGRPPYSLEGRSSSEIEDLVCDLDPDRPSTRLRRPDTRPGENGRDARTAEAIAEARGTSVDRLRSRLRGDLDAIVMTALRKEPIRRYSSVQQLSDDIANYIQGLPVSARAESRAYRFRKFVSRHRVGVAAAAGLVALLFTYATTTTVHNRRVSRALAEAELEANRSSQLTDLLLGLFETGSGAVSPDDSAAVNSLLARASVRADQMRHSPAARAQMLTALGRVHEHIGDYDRAAALLGEALRVRLDLYGPRHLDVAESQTALAQANRALNDLTRADALLVDALATERALLGDRHARIARTLGERALVQRDLGELGEAEKLTRESLEMRRGLLGPEHPDVATSLHQLAEILRRRGDYDNAGRLFHEALEMRRRLFEGDRIEIAESINSLAVYYEMIGDYGTAEPLYREALAMYRRIVGEEHPAPAILIASLGLTVSRLGKVREADSLLHRSLELQRRLYGPEHPEVGRSLRLLGLERARREEYRESEAFYRQSHELLTRLLGEDHLEVALSLHGLGRALVGQGRVRDAEDPLRQALSIRQAGLGDHPFTANTHHELGAALLAQDRPADAVPHFLEALRIRRELDDPEAALSAQELVRAYERMGRPAEADRYRSTIDNR
ncbi:MAG: tetratricopeptide repeat protein [Gemmatimonadetes bacterium]|nr:serine/threonine protein kinase [Gemmatimonadota bacterium]NIQ53856.1 serine/threonine protein kinase [Gemmatimonadota bacterium]NIU74023.1 tetratricopeptide repeat protein [Gammaproteobacteria bacterium]NIX44091.1 tetratricopeptide repeat protein [Gemmatimonadota bacterium]NIY08306.1 tetratricopeptide repeat protein [Gemmatimonadota bacterium]